MPGITRRFVSAAANDDQEERGAGHGISQSMFVRTAQERDIPSTYCLSIRILARFFSRATCSALRDLVRDWVLEVCSKY